MQHQKLNAKNVKINQNETKIKSIPLNFNLSSFAVISAMFPLLVGVFSFCIYYMQGRISGYAPTISETGTMYPNSKIFGQFMSTGSLTSFATLFTYYNYIKLVNDGKKLRFLKVLVFTSGLGILGLGFFPINEHHDCHLLSAVLGFLSILFFELLTLIHLPNDENSKTRKNRKILRLIFLILAFIGFFLFAAAKWVFPYRIDITVSTFAEWVLLIFMLFTWITWRFEIASLNVDIVLL